MGDLEDVRNTGLALALGSHEKTENHLQPDHQDKKKGKKEKFSLKYDNLFPSLTLGPSEVLETTTYGQLPDTKMDAGKVCGESVDLQKQASSVSGVSSFSNSSSIKKERESGGEEVEVERVSSRVSDEDEEASPRKKLRLTKEQSAVLEDSFKEHATLNPKQKKDLAQQLNLRPRQVEVWFQNRRARTKLKQTEVDCELLKKRCETLTDENKRLQKELQELKSLKSAIAAPFYMQLPAATLTLCPSCERVSSAGDGSSTNPFSIGAPKPHLIYNPFTHPSAAC
ncbi:homeobox-leucine zipper protein HAT22-like [Juglans microcarpa x Juglans regia]|uniref:homeobox-leucine zipper protein HAT22-like n=1 Tax=Juglans microcarpa x Juglans regia TaxID=2249226 RepID=UPI001B7EF58C|nr:homeobox-leucine zipper protein HAT22-like [Juglans microcarpa x Juglans regia]